MTSMGKKRNAYRVLVSKAEEKNRLRDLSIDGRITLKWFFKKESGRELVSLSDTWPTVMNLRSPQNARNFLTWWGRISSQEELCSIKLLTYTLTPKIQTRSVV